VGAVEGGVGVGGGGRVVAVRLGGEEKRRGSARGGEIEGPS